MPLESFPFIVSKHQRHPVANIYAVGRNFKDHASELGNSVPKEPLIFLKSSSSLRRWNDPDSQTNFKSETFHHEVELVLLVKQGLEAASWQKSCDIGLGIDLTRREVQTRLKAQGHPWFLAKSFKGSAIVSDFTPCEELTTSYGNDLSFQLCVNDKLVQQGALSEMVFSPAAIIQYINSIQPLIEGDLIFTGTPAGVGPVIHGDRLEFGYCYQGKFIEDKTYVMTL